MSARADLRSNGQHWRAPITQPQITRADILRTTYRHHPAMARLLRISVLRTACRTREAANAEKNVRMARWLADEAKALDAVAEILKELSL